MSQVHIVLQPKGGVGKSVVASFIAQYLKNFGSPFVAIDTDPNNATLSGYKALNAKRLEIMKDGAIIPRNFDYMIEQIVSEEDTNFVIDNGSANFFPFTSYMLNNDITGLLIDHGKQVYIHTVIKGGQEIKITLAGFNSLAEQMPEQAKIIVWLNEFAGEIRGDGKAFREMKVYKKNQNRVHGIVQLEHKIGTLHGEDLKQMLDSSLTFDEVEKSTEFETVPRLRLKSIKKSIFSQLDEALKERVVP